MGIISFLPLVLFIGWVIYYMFLMGDFIADKRMEEHMGMAGQTAQNYTSLFVSLALISAFSFGVMVYQIWHVWTQSNLPTGQKVMWVVFMAMFWVFAHPVYWYMHFRKPVPRRHNTTPALS